MSDDLDKETVAILRRIKRDAEVHWIADRAANSIEALTAEVASLKQENAKLNDLIGPALETAVAPLKQYIGELQAANAAAEAEAARLREGLKSIAVKAGTSECGGDYVRAVSLIGDLEQMADKALRGEEGCPPPPPQGSE